MADTHTHLPSLIQLKQELDDCGVENFIKKYSSYHFIIGDTDSIEFIKNIIKNFG